MDNQTKRTTNMIQEAIDEKHRQEDFVESLVVQSLGPALVQMLEPLLNTIVHELAKNRQEITRAIEKMNITVSPTIIPPDVHVPDIPPVKVDIPPISLPEVKIPPIRVPKPEVSVKAPTIKIPRPEVKITLPEDPRVVKAIEKVEKAVSNKTFPDFPSIPEPQVFTYDSPQPVILVDLKGDPYLPSSGSTGRAPQNIKPQIEGIAGLVQEKYDYVSLSYTGSNLTGVVFRVGGATGRIVSSLTLAYSGSTLTSVTKT